MQKRKKSYYLLCLLENNFNSYLKITFVISLNDLPSTPWHGEICVISLHLHFRWNTPVGTHFRLKHIPECLACT